MSSIVGRKDWKVSFRDMMAEQAYLGELSDWLNMIVGMSFDGLIDWLCELIVRRLYDWFGRNNITGLTGELLADFLLDVDYGTVMLWVDGVRYGDTLSQSPVWSVNPLYAPMKTVVFSLKLDVECYTGTIDSIDAAVLGVIKYDT